MEKQDTDYRYDGPLAGTSVIDDTRYMMRQPWGVRHHTATISYL